MLITHLRATPPQKKTLPISPVQDHFDVPPMSGKNAAVFTLYFVTSLNKGSPPEFPPVGAN